VRKIEPLPSGRFKVRYRHAGKQASQTFDERKDAARFAALLDMFKNAQDALDQLYDERRLIATPTLNDVAADHVRLLTGVEDGTRLTYERLWARTWGPLIGNLPASRITKDVLAGATNTLARTYSAKSLKNQRGLLAAVCDRAVDLGHLQSNPTKRLRLPRAKESERTEMRILTLDEFEDVLSRISEHYRPFVLFLGGVGCRYGEAVALQANDVRAPNVHIRRALKWSPDNKRTIGATKTRKSNRVVLMPPRVVESVVALTDDRPGIDLVFTAPRGGPIHHRTFWSDIWLPAVRHLEPRPRIHDLRHSHAAWLLADGVPIHVVQRRLGHESIQTTVDTYGGLLPDAQAAAAAAADAVFGVRPSELG
jgi:integrase